MNKKSNLLENLNKDIKEHPAGTIEQRAKRLNASKWEVFDALVGIDVSLIKGSGFYTTLDQIKQDYALYPLSSFIDRAKRLNVYASVVMKLSTLIPISELLKPSSPHKL